MIPSDKVRVNKSFVQIGKTSSGARGVENSSDKRGGLQMKSDKTDQLSFRQTHEKLYRNSSVLVRKSRTTNRTDKSRQHLELILINVTNGIQIGAQNA